MSLFLSFLSVLQTLIQFNEWSKRRHTLHRMVLVVPFFAVTILYRVLALALILSFAGGKFGLLPVFGLLLTQVSTRSFKNYVDKAMALTACVPLVSENKSISSMWAPEPLIF